MTRPGELRAALWLDADTETRLRLEFRPAEDGAGPLAVRLGIVPAADDEDLLAEAVSAAGSADVAVVIVGSAELTESEGFDRSTLTLPGRQDELITKVTAVNSNTIVVVNSGMPVLMPWAARAAAVLFAWLPGQAFGTALADVLLGHSEPGGRLPVTLPAAESDSPVLHAIPAADGSLSYSEGPLIGYRGYDAAGVTPRYPFGHGLGYTDWAYESINCPPELRAGRDLELSVSLTNTGIRPGKEVVQAYLTAPAGPATAGRPVRVLAGFAVTRGAAGESVRVSLTIPARLFARYDEDLAAWITPDGTYTVHIGRSSRDLRLCAAVQVSALHVTCVRGLQVVMRPCRSHVSTSIDCLSPDYLVTSYPVRWGCDNARDRPHRTGPELHAGALCPRAGDPDDRRVRRDRHHAAGVLRSESCCRGRADADRAGQAIRPGQNHDGGDPGRTGRGGVRAAPSVSCRPAGTRCHGHRGG
jgi:Glycosyl hydrolase family 3 C-terminal domain/Fibronectin type III-like domain